MVVPNSPEILMSLWKARSLVCLEQLWQRNRTFEQSRAYDWGRLCFPLIRAAKVEGWDFLNWSLLSWFQPDPKDLAFHKTAFIRGAWFALFLNLDKQEHHISTRTSVKKTSLENMDDLTIWSIFIKNTISFDAILRIKTKKDLLERQGRNPRRPNDSPFPKLDFPHEIFCGLN